MRKYSIIAALFVALALGGCASLATPHSTNGAVAYAGSTLQAVEDTAATEYPYMPDAQVNHVHALIAQAKTVRSQMVAAANAGNAGQAQSKLQMLTSVLGQIQAVLKQYKGAAK